MYHFFNSPDTEQSDGKVGCLKHIHTHIYIYTYIDMHINDNMCPSVRLRSSTCGVHGRLLLTDGVGGGGASLLFKLTLFTSGN